MLARRPLRSLCVALLGVLATTIFVGHVNNGHIRRLTLDANRTSVSRDQLVIDHTGQVLAVESRPGGPVYFSDASAIYVLTMVG